MCRTWAWGKVAMGAFDHGQPGAQDGGENHFFFIDAVSGGRHERRFDVDGGNGEVPGGFIGEVTGSFANAGREIRAAAFPCGEVHPRPGG